MLITTQRGVVTVEQVSTNEWATFTHNHQFLGAIQSESGGCVAYPASRHGPRWHASLKDAVQYLGEL